jgi:RNA polymerase sigma factor (TIGR02999 family)
MSKEAAAMAEVGEVTRLLVAYRAGDPGALEALVACLYDELRQVARIQLRHDRQREALGTTALVHEAYLRLADLTQLSIRDRGHFFAIAAISMRRIVVDFARERHAMKRGGGITHVPVEDSDVGIAAQAVHVLAVHEALEQLQLIDPTLTHVVECRFFAGYSEQETADALGLSVRTTQRAWARARAWLQVRLGEDLAERPVT